MLRSTRPNLQSRLLDRVHAACPPLFGKRLCFCPLAGDSFVVESNGYDDRSWINNGLNGRNPQKGPVGIPHRELRVAFESGGSSKTSSVGRRPRPKEIAREIDSRRHHLTFGG